MPRKHHHPKHTPYQYSRAIGSKKRYPTRQAAERAAEVIMLQQGGEVVISTYKDIDGGWYLTSRR